MQYKHILLGKRPLQCLKKRIKTFNILPCNICFNCYKNDLRNALRNRIGPSKSYPTILALIVKENDPKNAVRKVFGPLKSHPAL